MTPWLLGLMCLNRCGKLRNSSTVPGLGMGATTDDYDAQFV
jgi:hypothetical protein